MIAWAMRLTFLMHFYKIQLHLNIYLKCLSAFLYSFIDGAKVHVLIFIAIENLLLYFNLLTLFN